jgi:hypothetical protein
VTVPVAGRTVIELGARASVLEAVERIAAAPSADDLVLSIAAGAPAARNAVFFEVARRAAATRRLAIVSPDARARSLASSVHLPSFASTAALERQELDATEPLTSARRAALAQPVRIKRAATGPSPARVLGILGSLLAAALVLMVVIGPTATVVVMPKSRPLGPIEFNLRAGPDGEIRALTLVANDVTQKYTQSATGERLEPIKAKGVAKLSNLDSQNDIRVPKGTIVRTRDNVRFQTTEERVIPRSKLDILPPFVIFGQADVPIEALDAGSGGNVPANTITLTDRRDFAVNNPQATSGGETKKFAVVTGSDYGLAAGRADEELRKAALKKVDEWKKAADKGQVVYGPVTKVTAVTGSAGLVGTEPPNGSGTFEITVTGTATGYKVAESEPRATTIIKLRQQAASDYDINEAAAVVDLVIGPTLQDNGVGWRVRGSGLQFPVVKDAPLRTALAGRPFEEAQTVVEGQGLEIRTITVWPGWWPRLPFFDSRLRIEVFTGTSSASVPP